LAHESGFGSPVVAEFAVAGERWKVQQHCAPAEKSVTNMTWLLLSVSDWLIILIGAGGLLQ
jgi:hypothetical protein